MTEKQRIHTILALLRLPEKQYVVAGSGSMVMQGVERERPMGDLDLFVTTHQWLRMYDNRRRQLPHWSVFVADPYDHLRRNDPPYLHASVHGLPVHVFSSWRKRNLGNIDVAHYILNAVEVDEVRCTPLRTIFDWKREVGRDKDMSDIRIMAEMLEEA